MAVNENNDVARIVRRYGEASGAAEHQITWGLKAAGNALRKGLTATQSILAGMEETDRAVELIPELNHE